MHFGFGVIFSSDRKLSTHTIILYEPEMGKVNRLRKGKCIPKSTSTEVKLFFILSTLQYTSRILETIQLESARVITGPLSSASETLSYYKSGLDPLYMQSLESLYDLLLPTI